MAFTLVLGGGVAGTASREAFTIAFPDAGAIPFTIFTINVAGAFLLGLLFEAVFRRGPISGYGRTVQLLLGTGFLGGFTTYSAIAEATARLAGAGQTPAALVYAFGTLIVGAAATWAGIALGARRSPGARERPG